MFTTIPAGQIFYRGRQATSSTFGRWYAFDIESASKYGPLVGMYRTSRELRLINILSFDFRKDYADRLNMEYPGQDFNGDDPIKYSLMFPIGLPDLEKQKLIWQIMGQQSVDVTDLNIWSIYHSFHNMSRVSELNHDRNFCNKLQEYYGTQSDGWVCSLRPVNMVVGGFFHREIYINDAALMTYINDVPRIITGGSLNTPVDVGPFNLFKSNEEMMNFYNRLTKESSDKLRSLPTMLYATHYPEPPPLTTSPTANYVRLSKTRKNRSKHMKS